MNSSKNNNRTRSVSRFSNSTSALGRMVTQPGEFKNHHQWPAVRCDGVLRCG